jgi:signal transduction histidine kinase
VISLFRNREIQLFTLIIFFLLILTGFLVWWLISWQAMIFVYVWSAILILSFLLFTFWRYREISKLSSYLKRISNGDYSLDLRDNHEGELSILKSDIYKVTLMLSENSSILKEDKVKLMNAISDISHQLKTPLTSMMVMADLLSRSKLSEEKRVEFTRNIRIQLERMEWLVSSLLKLSKIDAGTVQFKKDPISIPRLIQKSVEAVLIPMDIKEQSLSIVGDENVSLLGDFNWTVEALINILKNCVEHTEEAGVITIHFSENPLYSEIEISDTGKGISKKDLPYIFKRFYRGENAGEDSVGIGLAMAYSIITSQNGDIQVSSEKGIGTRFQIRFYKQVI